MNQADTHLPEICGIPFGAFPDPANYECNCTNLRRLQKPRTPTAPGIPQDHVSRILPRKAYKTCLHHRVDWCNDTIKIACEHLLPQEHVEIHIVDDEDWDTFRDVEIKRNGGSYYCFRLPGKSRRLVLATIPLGGTPLPRCRRSRFLWTIIYRGVDYSARQPISSSHGWSIASPRRPSEFVNLDTPKDARFRSRTAEDDARIAEAAGVRYEKNKRSVVFRHEDSLRVFIAKRAMGYGKPWPPNADVSMEACLKWIDGWFQPIEGEFI